MYQECRASIAGLKMIVLMRSLNISGRRIIFATGYMLMQKILLTKDVLMMRGRCCSVQPHWFQPDDLVVNFAIFRVGAGQITNTHQEFVDNFAAGKPECFFEKLYP